NSIGFFSSASISKIDAITDDANHAILFVSGFYYENNLGPFGFVLDCGYGFITVADDSETLLLPTLELNLPMSDRMKAAIELGIPIANDWFYDYNLNENIDSYTISLGTVFLF
ncbi:MAG: hypothetical protein ABIJ45_14380, partial [Candidatus Zixiibacteriota bacterium]